jgi:hypothetical protein
MTIEELKQHVLNSTQHYYNKQQVIQLLEKIVVDNKPVQTSLF